MLPRGGMNSRMNLGSGSMPQENELQFPGNWMPTPPLKPVLAISNPTPVYGHGNHMAATNWQELPAFPSGYALGTHNYNGAVQNLNMVDQASRTESYYHAGTGLGDRIGLVNQLNGICNESIGWNDHLVYNFLAPNNAAPAAISINRNPSGNTGMASTSLTRNLDPQATNWSQLHPNQGQCSFLSLVSNDDSLQHTQPPQYGCPVPYRPLYNLNSPPRPEADAFSSIGNSIQFIPETPDQIKKLENQQLLAALNFSTDDGSNREKENQQNLVTSIGNEATHHQCDELLQNILESSVVNSTMLQEQNNSEKEVDPVELNKTPQQKPPKSRKHRPKVVVEGKPKRTPKSATPRNTKSKENPTGKRKYVRKKGLKESAPQQTDVLRETTDPSAGNSTRSCKRTLNFDPEKRDEEQDQIEIQLEMQQKKRPFNLNSEFHETEFFSGTTNGCKKMSAVQVGQLNGLPVENHVSQTISRYTSSLQHVTTDRVSWSEKTVESSQAPPENLQQELLNNLTRNLTAGNVNSCQNSSKIQNGPIQQNIYPERVVHRDFQVRNNQEKLDRMGQPSQYISYPTSTVPSNSTGTRGSKREYHATEHMHGCTLNRGSSSCQQIIQTNECNRTSSNHSTDRPESQKKKKIENGLHKNTWDMLSHTAVVEDSSRQAVKNSVIASPGNHGTYTPHKSVDSNRGNFEFSVSTQDPYAHSKPYLRDWVKQPISSEPHAGTERIRETNGLRQVHSLPSNEKCNLIPPTPPRKAPAPIDRQLDCVGPTEKQSLGSTVSNSVPLENSRLQGGQNEPLHDYQKNSGKTEGPSEKEEFSVMMEKIINGLKHLNLNDDRGKQIMGQEQNALVLYKADGSVVPYVGSDFIKKRKQRPKVDLDLETNRIWNLLMGKKGSEADEGLDKEKEKWWEEERRVFRGRADSFIARMHLVQGDRRFSQWKGSVVDSVIGVFLTQNVSDHLSSSAFMSLAAQFPPKSGCHVRHELDRTSVLIEPEVCVLNPNDTITWQEKIVNRPPDKQSSTINGSHLGIERTIIVETYSQSLEEQFLSSPDSFDSLIVQPYGGIRSYSGSNSDAEHPTTGTKETNIPGSGKFSQSAISFDEFFTQVNGSPLFHRGTMHGHLQIDMENNQQKPRTNRTENFKSSTFTQPTNFNISELQMPATPSKFQLDAISQPQVIEIDSSETASEEQTWSWPAIASGLDKGKDANDLYRSIRQTTNVKMLAQDNEIPRFQDVSEADSWALSRKENTSQPGSCTTYDQVCNGHQNQMKTFQPQETPVVKLVNRPETFEESRSSTMKHMLNAPELMKRTDADKGINLANKQKFLDNKLVESNSPVKAYDETNTSVSKAKKGKAEVDKNNAIEWDNLRRQVQANGRKKERSTDTMDSLDYEALRYADVNEISKAIRDRGMNNMLAERIKEFLNRLVRDHGSMDLEWLRDVPPDKAKDYLLSIRGLGLKSVECVRLLTLHHLAFPVDTNVGRIAVRLGWVPLQPLPESLHIHLLELYPVLESVQKYLWPRLCKLDQRTLYELHYQLITFGKVFCTKNKPNCNACPMRGECRHFASAFASARLALPGPEEKSITSATVPIIPDNRPFMVTNLMRLPQPEKNLLTARHADGKCEPIIEEPATPEQECLDVLESDIEDFFWEDPDEIPTIKLNVEAFSANVQHYMQEKMELQEGDMSKALVALNPEAASIPTPKLKNVSRLRTEHQVYELPDSHPLLKEMDRREPDDPSPYLLAIWRPGETADSIQPPEQRCESQEKGQLCDKETCFPCNSIKEACRTAMRGSFPLNGTYFQVNEVNTAKVISADSLSFREDMTFSFLMREERTLL